MSLIHLLRGPLVLAFAAGCGSLNSSLVSVPAGDKLLLMSSASNDAAPEMIDYEHSRDYKSIEELKRALSFKEVTAVDLEAKFDSLNGGKRHPRLLATAADFARLKQQLDEGEPFTTRAFVAIKARGQRYLNEPLRSYKLDAANLRLTAPHETQEQLLTLAFIYRMTGDTRFAEKVWRHLENYAKFPNWNPKHFLDIGIMSYSVAISYDWIYDYLNSEQRALITQAIVTKALNPGLAGMQAGNFWYRATYNWNPICNGGLSLAALAVMDEGDAIRPLASKLIATAMAGLPYYIREFEPDGQTVEGLMYWGYGLANFIRFSEGLKTALGSDFGYSDTPGLRNAATFPIYMSGPVAGVSIGDDPLTSRRTDSNFWFARRYGQPFIARYHLKEIEAYQAYSGISVEELLFYDPHLMAQDPGETVNPRLDSYVRDLEYVSLREKWHDPKALYIGIHAGDNAANHAHLDAGTFYIQGMGKVFALGGLGSDDYTFPGYFSATTRPGYLDPLASQTEAGRFHIYRLRAEGKNVVVMNPDIRPEQDPSCKPQVERIKTDAEGGFTIVDLSACYRRDAGSYKRGIKLVEGRSTLMVQDEIAAHEPSLLYWFMHTSADISLNEAQTEATLVLDGERMVVTLAEPEKAKFTVMDAAYLPGLQFPLSRNSPNSYQGKKVKKLAIPLKDVKQATLLVRFAFPDHPGFTQHSGPAVQEASKPLSDW
jgi:hypothetical protein